MASPSPLFEAFALAEGATRAYAEKTGWLNRLAGALPAAPEMSPLAFTSMVPALTIASARTGRAPPARNRFCPWSLNNCGPNDEPFSFHSGGVLAVFLSARYGASGDGGVTIGSLVGQSFNGTTVPLYLGYFLCGGVALAIVFVTEGGRFFVARHPSPFPAE